MRVERIDADGEQRDPLARGRRAEREHDRRAARRAARSDERHGGELYSSWPPGSKVSVPPPGSVKQGVPLAVRVSLQPCRAP